MGGLAPIPWGWPSIATRPWLWPSLPKLPPKQCAGAAPSRTISVSIRRTPTRQSPRTMWPSPQTIPVQSGESRSWWCWWRHVIQPVLFVGVRLLLSVRCACKSQLFISFQGLLAINPVWLDMGTLLLAKSVFFVIWTASCASKLLPTARNANLLVSTPHSYTPGISHAWPHVLMAHMQIILIGLVTCACLNVSNVHLTQLIVTNVTQP